MLYLGSCKSKETKLSSALEDVIVKKNKNWKSIHFLWDQSQIFSHILNIFTVNKYKTGVTI